MYVYIGDVKAETWAWDGPIILCVSFSVEEALRWDVIWCWNKYLTGASPE